MFQSRIDLDRMASTHRARKRIREAKRKARPELATREMWVQNDYANTFDLSWERVTLSFTNPTVWAPCPHSLVPGMDHVLKIHPTR